ncbi:flagellar basal body P-ring formation chaperone FlgA [Roseovarius aquimarinus]|uniref:Flagella basal body P-ring formation protein FlgA n=1 Tax=Roseovarius aquimarinus TaxID=1229156 RepID=A0ABW7I583_9RHOB
MRRALVALLAALALPAHGAPVTGEDARAAIREATEAAGVSGVPVLSSNRGFPPCAGALDATPMAGDWRAVRLGCAGAWSRVIRLDGAPGAVRAATPGAAQPDTRALILARSLARGTILAPGDLVLGEVPAAGQGDLLRDPAEAVGRRLRSNLGAGQALLPRHLEHDWAVTAGAPVTIVARHGAASIEAAGIALENGQIGQEIRAENANSGEIVHVRVAGPNKVAVRPNIR